MAIVEVARIQVRRGQENQTGIPQLAGGEFAWAADTEKLYIGLTQEDGGSRNSNVEILTENSLKNLFSSLTPLNSSASYVYRQGTFITSIGAEEHERSIQAKLDDGDVSIENFDIVGNDSGVDDAVFQIAIDNLFLNYLTLTDDPARVLTLPPKEFLISETIYIPKNTVIRGQGPDKTVLKIVSTGCHVFQTVDSQSAGRGSYITFPSINSNTQPDYIKIENLTLEFDSSLNLEQTLSLISLDCSNHTEIRNVKFKGNYTFENITATNYIGIDIRGLGAITSENILLENCEFSNLFYGIKSNYDIINPKIENCYFYDLNRGIVFNDPIDALSTTGPKHVKIYKNRFENIEKQAIFVGDSNSTVSNDIQTKGNQYLNVGNYVIWNEESSTGTSVLTLLGNNNCIENDYFNRFEFQYNNVYNSSTFLTLVDGNATLQLINNRNKLISSNSFDKILIIPITNLVQHIDIMYNISNQLPVSRSGTLNITIESGSNPEIALIDNYNIVGNSDPNIYWSTSVNTTYNHVIINLNNFVNFQTTINYTVNLHL